MVQLRCKHSVSAVGESLDHLWVMVAGGQSLSSGAYASPILALCELSEWKKVTYCELTCISIVYTLPCQGLLLMVIGILAVLERIVRSAKGMEKGSLKPSLLWYVLCMSFIVIIE